MFDIEEWGKHEIEGRWIGRCGDVLRDEAIAIKLPLLSIQSIKETKQENKETKREKQEEREDGGC